MRWHAPDDLEEALLLREVFADEATVHAGGTFNGILMNQRLIAPDALISLAQIPELRRVAVVDGELALGAMVTHRTIERDDSVRAGWPMLAQAFGAVASRRVRTVATIGGVLADADYASDPPSALSALDARVILRCRRGERAVRVDDLILGHYTTCIEPNELLVEVRVPPCDGPAVYRKFKSRSSEDRPCVSTAAAVSGRGLSVVVGACSERPHRLDELCGVGRRELTDPDCRAEIARGYAERLTAISDVRGSAAYRRRVCEVEVRKALEMLTG